MALEFEIIDMMGSALAAQRQQEQETIVGLTEEEGE